MVAPDLAVLGIHMHQRPVGIGHDDADRDRLEQRVQALALALGLARDLERMALAGERGRFVSLRSVMSR